MRLKQGHKLIADDLKATPHSSDRRIATIHQVDHKTVGAIRRKLEACGELPHVRDIIDSKGRSQPRKRKAAQMIPFPNRKYKIIYADPPWSYKRGAIPQGGVNKHYPTMSVSSIKALPVQEIADRECFLFMWVTFPLLPSCLQVIKAWGFEFKTLAFAWVKTNQRQDLDQSRFLDEQIDDVFGVGCYTKSNCEVCLLGVTGNSKALHSFVRDRTVRSTVLSPRREHSRKPDEVRDRIVQLLGDLPRIELFARERVSGWDSWGDEI